MNQRISILVLLTVVAVPSAGAQTLSVQTETYAVVGESPASHTETRSAQSGSISSSHSVSDAGTGTVQLWIPEPRTVEGPATVTADTYASAQYGLVRSRSEVTIEGPVGYGLARSSASMLDSISIGADPLLLLSVPPGSRNVGARFLFDWLPVFSSVPDLGAEPAVALNLNASVRWGQSALRLEAEYRCGTGVCSALGERLYIDQGDGFVLQPFSDEVYLTTPFAFDESIALEMNLETRVAMSKTGTSLESLANTAYAGMLGHRSTYWGGLAPLLDSQGNELTLALSSASGTDYSYSFAPVPLPSAAWLLLSSIGALGAVIRKRNRCPIGSNQPSACSGAK